MDRRARCELHARVVGCRHAGRELRARAYLIKSVLLCIPIYFFLSGFKCPFSVARRIEKIQCDFLWNDTSKKKKYHLVR